MSGVMESSQALMNATAELDTLSKDLLEVEREIAPIESDLAVHEDDFRAALWEAHTEQGEKHPPEDTRAALARKAFDQTRYHRMLVLRQARKRGKARLSDLREIVSAHRSIVSAAKTELEASEGPQPQWSGDGR